MLYLTIMAVSDDYKECGVRLIFLSASEYLQKENGKVTMMWVLRNAHYILGNQMSWFAQY